MNIHTFKLYTRVRNLKTGGVIISTFDIDRECDDPFRERMELCREYPRWAIGSDFKSTTDREYETLVDPKIGELYGGTIDVNMTDDLAISYKVHDGNTLKGPTDTGTVVEFRFEDPNDDDPDVIDSRR